MLKYLSPVYRANNYQNGDSEQWLGEWMKSRGVRDEIVLATKYTSPFKTYTKKGIQANYVGNNSKSLKTSLERSLKFLQTDYIDLVRPTEPNLNHSNTIRA
jgi:aryl-alcohol dehydrogenase-like predicted oxidoreductase